MKIPAEFEMFYSGLSGAFSVRVAKHNGEFDEDDVYFEVVEKSAYQSALNEIERLRGALEKIHNENSSMYLTKDDLLRSKYEIAFQALKESKERFP